jgi:hypothetical protein
MGKEGLLVNSFPQRRKTLSQSLSNVIPDESAGDGRDPWFDRLTTLSEVEGESRELKLLQLFLDPGSRPAMRDLAGMTNY